MANEARVRINAHRLMREAADSSATVHLEGAHESLRVREDQAKREFKRRAWWHSVSFVVAFVFTTGFLALSVLLWVRPENLFALVVVGVVTSAVFVASFATVRMVILHKLAPGVRDEEEDPGMGHHVGKSVAYGFIALVGAIVLAGLLINVATAFTV